MRVDYELLNLLYYRYPFVNEDESVHFIDFMKNNESLWLKDTEEVGEESIADVIGENSENQCFCEPDKEFRTKACDRCNECSVIAKALKDKYVITKRVK